MSWRARRRSRDDLNANADRKTEIAVRASLIDGAFGKPIRISYQKAASGGRSLKVLARSNTLPAATSLALGGSTAALNPVMALPK
jgi:hypothetical protein